MLSDAAVEMEREDTGQLALQAYYQCNKKSPACPMGFGQEDTIHKIWEEGHELRRKAGNPKHLIDYGAKDVYDKETGMKLPEKVVVYGSFQPYVGAVENDSNSEVTRMYYIGNDTYTLSVILPYSGTYDYAVSTYGTLSATYSTDRFPRSGSSHKGSFRAVKDNCVVRFQYRFLDHQVMVEMW